MDRRKYLGMAAAAGLAGLAGCSASAAERPPKVPSEDLREGGWKLVDESSRTVFEKAFQGVTVTADAQTRVYNDAELAADIEEKTLGQVSGNFASFFATRVTFDPNLAGLPGGVGREELVDQTEASAREEFEGRLRDSGLTKVTIESEGTFDVETGETARLTNYEAVYAFDTISFPVSDDRTVTVEGGAVTIEGKLAVWTHDDAVLVAGGAYPAENFARHVEKDVTEAVSVAIDVDLGLTPTRYREELSGLMRAVS